MRSDATYANELRIYLAPPHGRHVSHSRKHGKNVLVFGTRFAGKLNFPHGKTGLFVTIPRISVVGQLRGRKRAITEVPRVFRWLETRL
jgi:hypothetical protein